jgi:stringent starvation protein B
MNPLKPYLVRAIYDWIVDNQCTPYLLVDADAHGVVVPRQYVQDGKIVLNLRPQAVQGLSLGNQEVEFGARFGGTPMQITVPMRAVLAIYAQENGKGMIFDEEGDDDTPPPADSAPEAPTAKKKPVLKVVK